MRFYSKSREVTGIWEPCFAWLPESLCANESGHYVKTYWVWLETYARRWRKYPMTLSEDWERAPMGFAVNNPTGDLSFKPGTGGES